MPSQSITSIGILQKSAESASGTKPIHEARGVGQDMCSEWTVAGWREERLSAGTRWQAGELELPASLRAHRPGRTRWFRWEDELRRYAAHQDWSSWQSMA